MIDFEGKKYALVWGVKTLVYNVKPFKSGGFYYVDCARYNIDYWALHENKNYKEEEKMIYTQEMYDNKELPKVGMKFATCAGEYIAIMTNEKSVVFKDDEGHLIAINIRSAKPIDTRTDEEKAIDDLEYVLINEVDRMSRKKAAEHIINKIKGSEFEYLAFTGSK